MGAACISVMVDAGCVVDKLGFGTSLPRQAKLH